ncbi:L,D-transpeptidase family protein [bacterium]|nr:MAG: L,D-transpeptidase family protein [bacterium]
MTETISSIANEELCSRQKKLGKKKRKSKQNKKLRQQSTSNHNPIETTTTLTPEVNIVLTSPTVSTKQISQKPPPNKSENQKTFAILLSILILLLLQFVFVISIYYLAKEKYNELNREDTKYDVSLSYYKTKGFDLTEVDRKIAEKRTAKAGYFLNYILDQSFFEKLNNELALSIESQKANLLSPIQNLQKKLETSKSVFDEIQSQENSILNYRNKKDEASETRTRDISPNLGSVRLEAKYSEILSLLSQNELQQATESTKALNEELTKRYEYLEDIVNLIKVGGETYTKYDELSFDTSTYKDEFLAIYTNLVSNFNDENYTSLEESFDQVNQLVVSQKTQLLESLREETQNLVRKYNSLFEICTFYGCDLGTKVDIDTSDEFVSYRDAKSNFEKARESFDSYVLSRGGKENSKRIITDVSSQYTYVIENYEIIRSFASSTGEAKHPTKYGEFSVFDKIPNAWGYYEIWMPYWLSIYYAGGSVNGIHGIPTSPEGAKYTSWAASVGRYPVTYGCVMPSDANAKWLYNWAEIGTSVSIVK